MRPSQTVQDDRYADAIATVRAFAERSGAERVVLLIDTGDGGTATMVEWSAGTLELTIDDTTYPVTTVPDAEPRTVPDLKPLPPTALAIEPDTGELEAPLGAITALARGVLGLAAAFGGRSVATAEFATRDPALPITIAAREGEPLVLAAGDRRFVLPESAL